MRARLLALLLALLSAAPALAQSVVQTENVRAELLADASAIKPGEPFWVGLRQTIRPKWHTYWKNPGDSGLPTEIAWKLPEGAKAEPIVWPRPHLFDLSGVINYGFKDEAVLLVRITPPANASGSFKLAAEANWLVCEDVCIPEDGKFELTLPVTATGAPAPPATRAIFDKARQQLPMQSPWPARYGVAKSGDPTLIVEAKGLKADTLRDVYFFPADWGPIASMAKQTASIGAEGIRIPLKRGDAKAALPADLLGTLVLTEKTADGEARQAFDVTAKLDPSFVPAPSLAAAAGGEQLSLVEALLFALLGGLILNLMPCVFPVLSLKLIGLSKHRTQSGSLAAHGLAFTAGVVLSFVLLAALLLALQQTGEVLGWGFQLQTPWVIAALTVLFFVIGLNLLSVFEFTFGQGVANSRAADALVRKSDWRGSFGTGVLAVIVASPCTAPFMGAALGYAIAQPPAVALSVFAALGVGMALPYLLLTLFPRWLVSLPRPGRWMDIFKQLMAFPMFATCVWLLWVLMQQVDAGEVALALGALVAVGFALWALGLSQRGASGFRWVALSGAVVAALTFTSIVGPGTAGAGRVALGEGWIEYSRERLVQLQGEGKPVFVDFTAAWCVTCQINKRTVLDTDRVRARFAADGVVLMRADWTSRDERITQALAEFGRNGVPLYVLYDRSGKSALLPQLLTPGIVFDALDKIK